MANAAQKVGAFLIDPVNTAIVAGAGKAIKAATPKIPDINIPAVTAPTPMPIPGQDDRAAVEAKRASIREQLARRGRLSTILSQPQSEPLGGV